ncbi:hypothetical protein [Candidatus Nanohalobium constans]|uniref:Uncharacterized protein n=1 Tax=Candidatus Nanohalobium constans TaxID=2565781 RepID=A0A5Q0UFB6_9ARCH|nr:hypothetical protein [Candidatus Nanohalobium constans]QGA80051.1 hypothetical protein LC1Nh_0143 [Candidatus Nanohalobium constans]
MNYSIKPEEHELREARQAVEKTLEGCKYVLEKDEDLEFSLGHTGLDAVEGFGVSGTALSPSTAEIFFNTEVDSWKENLEDLTADIYGQTWFYENSEVNFVWQQVLASITGLMVIEKISDQKGVEIEDLQEEWAEKKTDISEQISEQPENLSWQLKTAIGHELLEEYELEEFPELNRTDVLEAGDSLFE